MLGAVLLLSSAAYLVYKLLYWISGQFLLSKLSDRYILITGCDTGFGNSAAKRLDKMGCHVIAGCLTEKGETELKSSCSERLTCVSMDVSKPESVRKAFDAVMKIIPTGKGLWGLINNAGVIGYVGPPEWLTKQSYQSVTDINLFGLIDVTMTFLPLIKKSGGRVVNMASIAGRISVPILLPYCVSKFAVEAFTDGLRRALYGHSVSVSVIEPGWFKSTPITSRSYIKSCVEKCWREASEEARQEFGEEYYKYNFSGSFDNFEATGAVSIEPVIDAYVHAVIARFPRKRYVVGMDANYIWLTIQALPEWIGDWLLCDALADKKQPPPAAWLNGKSKKV